MTLLARTQLTATHDMTVEKVTLMQKARETTTSDKTSQKVLLCRALGGLSELNGVGG